MYCNAVQHAATHCSTLLHAAPNRFCRNQLRCTYCNIRQHIATRCNTLQHTATNRSCRNQLRFTYCNVLQYIATHCNPLQHAATHRSCRNQLTCLRSSAGILKSHTDTHTHTCTYARANTNVLPAGMSSCARVIIEAFSESQKLVGSRNGIRCILSTEGSPSDLSNGTCRDAMFLYMFICLQFIYFYISYIYI